ncbi:MAG: DNA-processing protein DprA [Endomicrobiales bacterium]
MHLRSRKTATHELRENTPFSLSPEQRALLTLHLVPEVGPKRCMSLLRHFGSAREALGAPVSELSCVEDISQNLAAKIACARERGEAEREMALAEKLGVRILTCQDPEYPETVRMLPDYPAVLYVRGTLTPADTLSVALVGTRRPTAYGRNVASRFARELAGLGVTTVSGLARGIDTEVHDASLSAGGRTLAVLGNGLNRHYPPENRKLEEKLMRSGALVSEFPLDFPPDRANFPRRNRIIAALALATVVVEADIKSGALITSSFALEQGKDVFAVPGPIFSPVSRGTHHLLKSGAGCAESADDIVEAIRPLAEWVRRKRALPPPPAEELPLAGSGEEKILSLLEEHCEGVTVDQLVGRLRLPLSELSTALLELEMKGLVRALPGKLYVKNR